MRGRPRRPAAVALVAALVAACGLDAPVPSPTPTPAPEPTPTLTTYPLDTAVWYAGLVLTFGTATAELDRRGGTVSVPTSIENPGPDDLTLAAPIRIVAGRMTFEPTRESVLPSIAAGATGYTTLTYQIVGLGSIDDAVLRVGDPGDHQAVVPFVADDVSPVTLEPRAPKVSGTGNASDLRVTLRSAELRWDLPDWGEELPSESAALTVTYDASYRGSFSGGFAFTGDNVALKLPDGTIVEARRDGRSQSVALIGTGRTVRGLSSRFEIPSGTPGTYVLLVRNGSAQGTIRIVIPR